jgi:hypothetical protein
VNDVVVNARQMLDDILSRLAGQVSRQGDERDDQEREQAHPLHLFASTDDSVNQHGGRNWNADHGDVIKDDMEVCRVH